MKFGSKSTQVLPSPGTVWFGDQQAFDDYSSTLGKVLAMSAVEQSEMRMMVPELRANIASSDGHFNNHYMVDTYGDGRIATLSIQGSLLHHPLPLRMFGLPVTTYGEIQEALAALMADPKVERILLTVGSGGGNANGLFRTSNFIERSAKLKRIDTFSDSAMGSAAYWLGVNGKEIFAELMAEVGSIGVYAPMVSVAKANEAEGREVRIIRAGEFKALGEPNEPISEKAVAEWQRNINRNYEAFLDHTSSKRGIEKELFRNTAAEGRTFSGESAVQVGLVDKIMVFDDVIDAMLSAKKTSVQVPGGQVKKLNDEGLMNKKQLELLRKMGVQLTSVQEAALASGAGYASFGFAADLVAKLDALIGEDEEDDQVEPVKLTEKQERVLLDSGVKLSDEQTAKLSSGTALADIGLDAELLVKLQDADKEPTKVEIPPALQGGAGLMELVGQITQLTTDLALVKLERDTLKTQLSASSALLDGTNAHLAALAPLVAASINKMELALSMGVSANLESLTPDKLVETHQSTLQKFETRYPVGQRSTTAKVKDVPGNVRQLPPDFQAAAKSATKI